MVDTVLVPIDGSDAAWTAFDYALDPITPETVHVIYVMSGPTGHPYHGDGEAGAADMFSSERDFAAGLFEEARQRAESIDSPPKVHTDVLIGRPSERIVSYAADADVDHVVMGSTGRDGAERLLLGSVSETVVRRAPVPVTVTR
ncbi:MAG: universal stress protein [Halobacteriota archaeon]